ncbi:hypothetical protein [Actinophytocola oryzae]|uniref:Uncharacterized protein n=1 Tax=Actinophytocola oryzae TaxID=502181 RepID=A0A4R7V4W5_9PSEU|nr:hypothetical protein [Actinophytocola oryzae]TDV43732.1 hypothetical protein CLV71_115196 [Actinophytocola oryzae]
MGRRPEPRRTVLGGVPVVILRERDYEQLDAHRRQIGARTAQLHNLRQQLTDAATLFDAVEAAVTRLPECAEECADDPCARHTLQALLAGRHEFLGQPGHRT